MGSCEYKPGVVKLASARLNQPNGRVIYPLTVTSWTRKVTELGDTYIIGTVRNDSGHRLVDIRVVGILIEGLKFIEFDGSGPYFEAVLESTTLNPGKKTDFRLDYYYPIVDVSEFSAQGVAEP